jgi:serine/threonine kinase PknH
MTTPGRTPRERGPARDEETRPVGVGARHDELTVVIDSGKPRPANDDGGEWLASVRPTTPRLEDGSVSASLAFESSAVKRRRIGPVVIAAIVAGAALIGILGWQLWPAGGSRSASASKVDGEAQKRLIALLPAGYSPGACTPAELPKDAVAAVNCTKNADADGPTSASFTLMKDDASLSAAVGAAIAHTDLVDCPGNIQSPGPWRRNANPLKIAGTLVCGLPEQRPQVTWTDDAALVLNVVRAGPEGPTLDQLYEWWSAHS